MNLLPSWALDKKQTGGFEGSGKGSFVLCQKGVYFVDYSSLPKRSDLLGLCEFSAENLKYFVPLRRGEKDPARKGKSYSSDFLRDLLEQNPAQSKDSRTRRQGSEQVKIS